MDNKSQLLRGGQSDQSTISQFYWSLSPSALAKPRELILPKSCSCLPFKAWPQLVLSHLAEAGGSRHRAGWGCWRHSQWKLAQTCWQEQESPSLIRGSKPKSWSREALEQSGCPLQSCLAIWREFWSPDLHLSVSPTHSSLFTEATDPPPWRHPPCPGAEASQRQSEEEPDLRFLIPTS